ncbi:hypothetical protein Pres01_32950 [Metapseudomonas resinovorans]|uniref:cysteine hydrolase n=1 Tax=Metapseudomonas resinovorans TaxID=53412 RepID=UPI000987D669|nr:cysteine hydrolase [Pseudomonas resinovorans]GLZ87244.1 hypothetical protein Pres01_32950 [Pseudomonas resinovorans]
MTTRKNFALPRLAVLLALLSTAGGVAARDSGSGVEPERLGGEGKAALLLVEYQHEWLDPSGKLHHLMQDREQFDRAVEASRRLLAGVRKAGLPVIHAGLNFTEGYPELGQAGSGLREAIPRVGTFRGVGASFMAPFIPQAGEFVISGRQGASAFSGSNLDSYLRNQGIDTLLIAGFALHVCVESTLRAAHDLGYNAVLVADATAAFTSEQRHHVLAEVVHHFGQSIEVDQLIGALEASGE